MEHKFEYPKFEPTNLHRDGSPCMDLAIVFISHLLLFNFIDKKLFLQLQGKLTVTITVN